MSNTIDAETLLASFGPDDEVGRPQQPWAHKQTKLAEWEATVPDVVEDPAFKGRWRSDYGATEALEDEYKAPSKGRCLVCLVCECKIRYGHMIYAVPDTNLRRHVHCAAPQGSLYHSAHAEYMLHTYLQHFKKSIQYLAKTLPQSKKDALCSKIFRSFLGPPKVAFARLAAEEAEVVAGVPEGTFGGHAPNVVPMFPPKKQP